MAQSKVLTPEQASQVDTRSADRDAEIAAIRAAAAAARNDAGALEISDAARQRAAELLAAQERENGQRRAFAGRLEYYAGGLPCVAAQRLFGKSANTEWALALGGSCPNMRLDDQYQTATQLISQLLRKLARGGIIPAMPSAVLSEWAQSYVVTGRFFSKSDFEPVSAQTGAETVEGALSESDGLTPEERMR